MTRFFSSSTYRLKKIPRGTKKCIYVSSGHGAKLYPALSKFILLLEFMVSVRLLSFPSCSFCSPRPPSLVSIIIESNPSLPVRGVLGGTKKRCHFWHSHSSPFSKLRQKSYSCSKKQTGQQGKKACAMPCRHLEETFLAQGSGLSSSKPTSSAPSSVISEQVWARNAALPETKGRISGTGGRVGGRTRQIL